MINWLHSPKNPIVAQYVERFWFLERKEDSTAYEYPKLNPDPCAHLIIASPNHTYQYDINEPRTQGEGSHWLFPYHKTYEMDHSRAFAIIGIKFHVGALYSLNTNPLKPTINQIAQVNINALLNTKTFSAAALLTLARAQPERCCETLDTLLSPWISQNHQDNHSNLVRRALPLLVDTPISNIGNQLHCSQRTLERSFLKVTGFTLKQCQSMNKLEDMLHYLYQLERGDINWADIANIFGFNDQPHLIRYLKSTIGATPGEYAKQRNLTIDIYGGVETS